MDSDLLASKSVIVIGAGALGVPASVRLASVGVGRVGLVDDADVGPSGAAESPLPRADGRARRADVAAAWLATIAPDVQAEPYPARLDPANAVAMIDGFDLVLDLSNDAATRRSSGEAALELGVPRVTGGLGVGSAWLAAARPAEPPCFECLEAFLAGTVEGFTTAPTASEQETRAGAPRAALAGAVGELAALAALNLLGDQEPALRNALQTIGEDGAVVTEPAPSRPECPRCARRAEGALA